MAAAARVSQNLGNLHNRRDAYAEAVRHFRDAAVLFARLGEHENSVMADIGLAGALTGAGDFDEAARIHARARMRAATRQLEPQLAQLDESEGLLDLARGRYREALAGLESARRRYERLALPQYQAIAEKQLADAYLELRLLPEAFSLFDAAVTHFAALALPDEQAWALAQRGRAEALLGRAAADASLAAAAALFAAQGNAVGEAAVALARAELALARGDAAAAQSGADAAVQGFSAAGQADGRARAEVIQAQALLQAGSVAQAGAVFTAALARARALQQLQVQVRCLTGQGLVAQAQGDRVGASRAFEAAIELFEDQRRALPGDEIRSAFLSDHLRPYQELLRAALADTAPAQGMAVLLQLERFRARALDEQLAAANHPAAEPDAAEVQPLRDRLNWLYRRVQRLHDEAEDSPALREELLRTERELLERARRQRLAAPLRKAGAAAELDLGALRRALRPGDALVEYGVVDDELFACVVTPAGVALQRCLADWPEVLEAVRAARFQVEALGQGAAPLQRHMPLLLARAQARLARLHALIWAPLAGPLGAVQRVLVVPHAQLGAVPFAALHDGEQALGKRCQIAMVPSARAALRGLQRPPQPARRALALGESSRLPHAALEATRVAALFERGEAFVGAQATLQALRANASQADVLHLACHAQFRGDNPRFSALHLHDGALTVEMAEALDLAPCTVVLSACETALAESGQGGEMVGLVRAFLVAGAARVVASLWPVDDAVTAGFMTAFHAALVAGQAPTQALGTAQDITRRSHPHPCFWGAFTLYGGW